MKFNPLKNSDRYPAKVSVSIFFLLLICMFFLSGCALLEVPGMLIGGTFKLLGQLIGLAGKLPKPPPGIF